jgi:cytochrome c-type biogenesis protein CcmH/NrfG
VHLWPLLVGSYLFAAERIVQHVLKHQVRLLDHEVECRVVEKEGSEGLLNLAELERARQHRRRRLRLSTIKGKERASPQKSLPVKPVDERPAA